MPHAHGSGRLEEAEEREENPADTREHFGTLLFLQVYPNTVFS